MELLKINSFFGVTIQCYTEFLLSNSLRECLWRWRVVDTENNRILMNIINTVIKKAAGVLRVHLMAAESIEVG